MKHYLYQITNRIDDKIYIGVHSTNNLNDGYFGSGLLLKRSLQKYSRDNFDREIIAFFETREECLAEEAKLVNEAFVLRDDTYNCVIGGGGGSTSLTNGFRAKQHSDDTKKKQSEASKRLWSDAEKLQANNAKISKTVSNQYANGRPGTFVGKSHTKEAKDKMSKAAKNRKTNSQSGTMWITNGSTNRKIKINDVIPETWYKGRKM